MNKVEKQIATLLRDSSNRLSRFERRAKNARLEKDRIKASGRVFELTKVKKILSRIIKHFGKERAA